MRERLHTTINGKLKKEIQLIAIQEGRNVNDILEELISEYINKYKGGQSDECNKRV